MNNYFTNITKTLDSLRFRQSLIQVTLTKKLNILTIISVYAK